MKTTNPIKISAFSMGLAALAFLTVTANSRAQTQCVDTNGVKYLQPPNLQGLDVWNSGPWMLADDFICTNNGPITDIHIWGSWLSDSVALNSLTFTLGIYDDVPVSPVNSFSHPGNLLWQQTFAPGQYSESFFAAGSESFLDPGPPATVGTDSQAWYYCFYPTNPFVQTGTNTAPKTYWIAAYANLPAGDTSYRYGWKTTPVVQNDVSVHAPWTGSLPLSGGGWLPTMQATTGGPLDLAFLLTTPTPTPPCCPEPGAVKYVQPPNLINGVDVDARDILGGTLADDFPCTNPGPITDIHLWGSWLNDQVDPGATFILTIWSDVPASPAQGTPSHPGTNLWSQTFLPGEYTLCPYTNVPEAFDNPNYAVPPVPALIPFGSSTNLYYLCFYPSRPFVQQGTAAQPTNYWLSVTESDPNATGPFYWGWKSSSVNYNDAAVYNMNPTTAPWTPITDPLGNKFNFAFKINTLSNSLPPVVCVESDYEKYVQGPNTINGFDVWNSPYVLADDFVCTNTGPISDIHLWGSWLSDNYLTNTITFWLGIYDDVPTSPGNTFSHPGTNLLWQQWFAPGQYAETIWTANASEQFLDPGQTNILGTDSEVWYYCFYPTNAFQQTGTPQTNKTYWLAAYAQLPAGIPQIYGWKTTTNVLHDTSVHAFWPGTPPTANPGWTPTVYQPPTGGPVNPLDLSFKLTMCGPVKIRWVTPNNVVLTWPGGGYLQSATNVLGPYVDVPGFPPSPYTDSTVIPPTNRFYRVRCY